MNPDPALNKLGETIQEWADCVLDLEKAAAAESALVSNTILEALKKGQGYRPRA